VSSFALSNPEYPPVDQQKSLTMMPELASREEMAATHQRCQRKRVFWGQKM
jgi:hypothetical protein